jgi:hypothetical protein
MNQLRFMGLVLLLGSVSGCSLVALSDDLVREQCESNAECESLNEADRKSGDYEPCTIWQCQDNNYCEKTARDLDDDGFFAADVVEDGADAVTCEVAAAEVDCDDGDEDRNQSLDEACDNVDNDCDELVDEGSLKVETNDVVVFDETHGDAVSDVSFAVDPGTGALEIAYSLASGTGTPGLSVVAETLELTGEVNVLEVEIESGDAPDSLVSESVGVTGLQSGQLAVGMVNRSGRPRVIAGVVTSASSAGTLHVDAGLMNLGLRCEATEDCFANHQEPPADPLWAVETTVGVALASSGREVLMSYVRDPAGGSPACGSLIGASDAPYILINALRLSSTQDSLTETGSAALRVDVASTTDAPALLSIPGGYLLGYVDSAGDVVVARLEIADGEPVVAQPQVVRIQGKGEQQAGVALALDGNVAADATEFVLGVAYQTGCAPESQVRARLYDVSVTGSALSATQRAAVPALSDGPNQSRPAISYNADKSKWAVVFRDAQGLRARLLEADGTLTAADEEPYLLLETITNGADETRVGLSPTVTDLGSGTWFGAVAYVSQPGNADEPFAFRAARMVCAND